MKKVIALLMVLAVFSTTVFAAPISLAGSLDAPLTSAEADAIKGSCQL
ncbi:MAG: hypothetical protein LBP80_06640 [Treponema sp.]|jgi:hypothetical protein|nr:hypothetical protein [Treponema sp.]